MSLGLGIRSGPRLRLGQAIRLGPGIRLGHLFKALRAVRRARFWDYVVLCSFVFCCFTGLEFCIIFDTLLRPCSVFWSHLCYFNVILGALWIHFLHQETDWSAKAATRGAKGQNANINSFGDHLGNTFLIFPRRAPFSSMSFRGDVLVMLSWCICVPFLRTVAPISCSM